MAAQFCQIFNSATDTGDQFVDLRAGFPTLWNLIGGWANLIGPETLQVFPLPVKCAHVRPEEFVRRANEKVAIQRFHIDQAVRTEMYRIHISKRACPMRQLNDFPDGIDRSHSV